MSQSSIENTPSRAPSHSNDRRLERAANHVDTHWFPCNPSIAKKIRENLSNGLYQQNIQKLISDLQSDFALFTFCLQRLRKSSPSCSKEQTSTFEISALFDTSRHGEIEILCTEENIPSSHLLTVPIDPLISSRLKETSIAAAAAESLARSFEIHPLEAVSHSLVHQVGLSLIAWNYSSVYLRAAKAATKSNPLELEISKQLGFSPGQLTIRVFGQGFVNTGVDKQNSPEDSKLSNLCSVSEVISRADQPEIYPYVLTEWPVAKRVITSTLGVDGLDIIRRRALELAASYKPLMPSMFTKLESFHPEQQQVIHQLGKKADQNQFLQYCTDETQKILRLVYVNITSTSVRERALEQLVKEAIPIAGFIGGQIYSLTTDGSKLVPSTVFGKVAMRSVKTLIVKKNTGPDSSGLIGDIITTRPKVVGDAIEAAFESANPIVETTSLRGSSALVGISCRIGNEKPIGVLYLECITQDISWDESRLLKTFKAIHQTLMHALGI